MTYEYLSKLNQLFVKTSGNKNGDSLVMLHGWGMNSGAWEVIRPALESQYLMHWVDLPGYGENTNIVAKKIDDIVDLVIPHIPKGSHLVGWSLGGVVAQAIAKKISKKPITNLKTLTLIASSPKFSQADDWEHAISHETLDGFSENLQRDSEATFKRFVALQFMGIKGAKHLQKGLIDEILADFKHKSSKKGGGGINKSAENSHFEALNLGLDILKHADYRNVKHTIPQHWIMGDRDRLIPPLLVNDLSFLRPDDQITLLKNTGHAPFMTHPEEFLENLISFIECNKECKQ